MQNRPSYLKLDNSAKIYPAASSRKWSILFRLSINLTEDIDPVVLQSALDVTVKRFPSIAVKLNNGLFWYYLETIKRAPLVMPDFPCPCSVMKASDIRRCAFRVFYYKNRIAVEFFHALTDGTGGTIFLKTLAAEYISQKYRISISNTDGVLCRTEEPLTEELEDSFLANAGPVSYGRADTNSYKLTGTALNDDYINVVNGIISLAEIKEKAKHYGVSITTYIAAVMISVIIKIQNKKKPVRRKQKPVKVMIPINLRAYMPSSSLRNFTFYITPGIDPRFGEYSFDEIIKQVYHQMGAELNSKSLQAKITTNVRSEKNYLLRLAPLFLKNFAMRAIYRSVGEKKYCVSFSNMGLVKIPNEMKDYVERFDFVLGMSPMSVSNSSAVTYGDKMIITFVRNIKEAELERLFFTELVEQGIHVTVESNLR